MLNISHLLLVLAVAGAAAGAAIAAARGKISAEGLKIRHILHVFCFMLLLEACLFFVCHIKNSFLIQDKVLYF